MRWRKVSEELPKVSFQVETDWGYKYRKSTPIVFVDKNGYFHGGRYEKDPQRQACFTNGTCLYNIGEVTHWIPQSELIELINNGEKND